MYCYGLQQNRLGTKILNDCLQMIIQVINEIFLGYYTENEKIEFHPNKHFIGQQDAANQERITDY